MKNATFVSQCSAGENRRFLTGAQSQKIVGSFWNHISKQFNHYSADYSVFIISGRH